MRAPLRILAVDDEQDVELLRLSLAGDGVVLETVGDGGRRWPTCAKRAAYAGKARPDLVLPGPQHAPDGRPRLPGRAPRRPRPARGPGGGPDHLDERPRRGRQLRAISNLFSHIAIGQKFRRRFRFWIERNHVTIL